MNDVKNIEQEIARLIVDTLHLDDITPEQIEAEAPLFGDGLGLDSLDMLELSMEVEQKYGVALRSDDPEHIKIFVSLRRLSEYIQVHRVR
jgi:acyl carrier protein